MKQFRPLKIKKCVFLSDQEMKNIFGGSGESGETGEKCKMPGAACMITFSHKNPGDNSSSMPVPPPMMGTCQNFFPSPNAGISGALKLTSGCNCVVESEIYISDELYTASHDCESDTQ